MQAIWDSLWGREAQFINSQTVKVNEGANGISWDSSGGSGGGTSLIQCVVTELYNTSYIGVTKFTNGELDGDQFYCSKCLTGRMPAQETIDGQLILYNNYGAGELPVDALDNTRLAAYSDTNNEWQVMHPRYIAYAGVPDQCYVVVSKILNAPSLDTTEDGDEVQYLEISPSRFWTYSPYLNGGND